MGKKKFVQVIVDIAQLPTRPQQRLLKADIQCIEGVGRGRNDLNFIPRESSLGHYPVIQIFIYGVPDGQASKRFAEVQEQVRDIVRARYPKLLIFPDNPRSRRKRFP